MTDVLMIILRLIHIFAGVFWVGSAAFLIFFVSPTVKKLGPDGGKFMTTLIRLPSYGMYFPILGVLTLVSGLLMYYKISDHFSAEYMKSGQGIVLSIGAVAGVLAFGHGGATLGRASNKMIELAKAIEAQGSPPTPEQGKTIAETSAYIELHSRIGFGMQVLALAGMAAARWV